MTTSAKNQANPLLDWPETPSEILMANGNLQNEELILLMILFKLGKGENYRFINLYDQILNEINLSSKNYEIYFNPTNKLWFSGNNNFPLNKQLNIFHYIFSNWKGVNFGSGEENVYFVTTTDELWNSIFDKKRNLLIKIGSTKQNLSNRIKDLNTGNPDGLIKLFSVKTSNANILERKIQSNFDLNRYQNIFSRSKEWFNLDLVYLIEKLGKII